MAVAAAAAPTAAPTSVVAPASMAVKTAMEAAAGGAQDVTHFSSQAPAFSFLFL